MKKVSLSIFTLASLFSSYLIISLIVIIPFTAKCQCGNFYAHTFNYYAVYPGSINVDILNNGGNTNLRIRTFQNGNGNKIIMDNPDALSTVRYGGLNQDFYSLNTCGLIACNTPNWTDYGLLADNSTPSIHIGTSYIPVTVSINGVYKCGWVKIGITATADTVFLYSVMIDQTSTSNSFTIGQCDVTWPTVCTTTEISETITPVNALRIYPNPATNELFIETSGMPITEISIYNTTGSLLSQVKQPQSNRIDVRDFATGIYIAEIKTKEKVERIKWCKSN